jgi:hypothetical protein
MPDDWMPLCLVPACDLRGTSWPLPCIAVDEALTFRRDGVEVPFDAVFPLIVAAVSRSAAGRALIDRVETGCATPRGRSLQALRLDIEGDPAPHLVGRLAAELARAGRGGLGRAHGEGVGLQRGLPAHALVGVELGKGHVEHHQAGNEPGQDQHPAGGAEPAVGEVEDAQQAGVHRRAG